ncbi:MAG: hypothetical protein WCI46_13340 [Verrucomicrobiota bacterium]
MLALLSLFVGVVVLTTATAQTSTDPNEGSRLTYDSVLGSYDFSWWGQPGRTYFLQHSDDLLTWEYLPLIESGTDGLLSWSFTSTASKFFLRLRFSDIPTNDPFSADFDGDKVSNDDELLFGTDPLVSTDSDLDGLPDDWEKAYFGNLASGATDDPDSDGLSNLAEFMHGTNPNSPDSDFDGLSDGDEVNIHGTDPLKWDSDGDTLPDGWEVQYGINPLAATDAAETAAGGGMTNLQHYEMGSNPNEPPPPPTIIAGTATFDLNADTPLFPAAVSQFTAAATSQPLLINGDFSAPSLGDSDWDKYPGIPGWTAISGSLIELQQREVNTTANACQYCELDSHWRDGQSESDHGIQQTVDLPRGQYVLVFDYRGRFAGADSFIVRAQVGSTSPATLPVDLAARNGAATTWSRAVTTFEVTGGNPNLATVPITLLFDIADAADSYGAYIDNVILLPLEVKDVSNGQVISDTARIKGHTSGTDPKPEMPKLEARFVGAPAGWQVEWKLENRYPRRAGRDDLNIPNVGEESGIFVAGDQPWKIWEEINNSSGLKFFGGDVKLKYTIYFGASLAVTGEVSFKIRGENPDAARCKAHIVANQGSVWYAWAIAKHESRDSTGIYNEFANGLANGGAGAHGAKGEPFYSPQEGDGWGLFQRDSASGHFVTTEETWSWDGNMKGFLQDEYPEHLGIANTYVNGVRSSHPTTFEEPQFTIKGRSILGRDVLALTWYNGPQGRSNASMLRFDGSKPSGARWSLKLPNAPEKTQPYVYEILDESNGG